MSYLARQIRNVLVRVELVGSEKRRHSAAPLVIGRDQSTCVVEFHVAEDSERQSHLGVQVLVRDSVIVYLHLEKMETH